MKTEISNLKLDFLGDELKKIILDRKGDFFETIEVVVPSLKTEQWFKAYWLKTEPGVLMNVKFVRIEDALLQLINTEKDVKLISHEELSMLIIKHLLSNTFGILPKEISSYFIGSSGSPNAIKLYDIADSLASLFIEYDIDCFIPLGWEKELYDEVMEEAFNNHNLGTLRYLFEKKSVVKRGNNPLYIFGFSQFSEIEKNIIDEYSKSGNVFVLNLEQPTRGKAEPDTITAAASKIREIEAVHSRICELLEKDSYGNRFSDFLVIAPNVSVYETAIKRVFEQDGKQFPDIPYVLNDRKKIETDVVGALRKLEDIAEKRFCTRADFYSLITNSSIRKVHDISQENIENWNDAVINMKIFRERENGDDWDYAKKRILLSKISDINDIGDNVVMLSNTEYLPYSGIGFDDESIAKMVEMIDRTKSWYVLTNGLQMVDKTNISAIVSELDSWFSAKNKYEEEKNYRYKKIKNTIDIWQNMNMPAVPFKTFLYFLYEAGTAIKSNFGDYFTNGVTFTNFDEKSILSAKYVFFLNAGSNQFPSKIVISELDQRTDTVEIKRGMIEDAFLLQSKNCDEFHVSYINRNLKTDEEFYLSSLVDGSPVATEITGIEKKADWNRLFTKKEYKDKENYENTVRGKTVTPSLVKSSSSVSWPQKIRDKDMGNFICEPLKYRLNKAFGYHDDSDEKMGDEYEPFGINNLDKSIELKSVLIEYLKNSAFPFDADLMDTMKKMHRLPDITPAFTEEAFKLIKDEFLSVKELLEKNNMKASNLSRPKDLKLKYTDANKVEHDFTIISKDEICISVTPDERVYIELKKVQVASGDIKKDHIHFSTLYIDSLIDVASLNDDTKVNVRLIKDFKNQRSFSVTPSDARCILTSIYGYMNEYEKIGFMPITYINDDRDEGNPNEHKFEGVMSDAQAAQGVWKYFEHKNMVDIETQLGYTKNGFTREFYDLRDKMTSLVLYV